MRRKDKNLFTLPLLPLMDGVVLLPGAFTRIRMPAESSRALMDHLSSKRRMKPSRDAPFQAADVAAVPVLLSSDTTFSSAQEDEGLDLDKVHSIGVAATVVELIRLENTDWMLVIKGRYRISVEDITLGSDRGSHYMATVRQLDYFQGPYSSTGSNSDKDEERALRKAILQRIKTMFLAVKKSGTDIGGQTLEILEKYTPAAVADLVGSLVARSPSQRLSLLSNTHVVQRLRIVNTLMQQHLDAAGIKSNNAGSLNNRQLIVHPSAKDDSDSDDDSEVASITPSSSDAAKSAKIKPPPGSPRALLDRLKASNPPQEVLEAAHREYIKLKRTNEQHPGYGASLTYLETLASLPWSKRSIPSSPISLNAVRARLDADHYGLDKVKDRIVQFVAVQLLKGRDARAPILCLVGPPGVGKTSVARSMAAALQKPFQRISLGGVRDEAEIRGHRRTYIGALPGRITQALQRANACDALLLLDEVDKTGRDSRGDPAAALLEVLDPEQNSAFRDTYLGVSLDLSRVVFVCTANNMSEIPPPLLDRMEVVNLSGYTLQEKVEIASMHLVPQTLKQHGIAEGQLVFDKEVLRFLVEGYTREAGVREIRRCLAAVCRHVAVDLVNEKELHFGAAVEHVSSNGAASEVPSTLPSVDATSTATSATSEEERESDGDTWESAWKHQSMSRTRFAFKPPPQPALGLLGPGSMAVLLDNIHDGNADADNKSAESKTIPTDLSFTSNDKPIIVDVALIEQVLGPRRFKGHDAAHRVSTPGTAAGLVWTAAGGKVQFIETLHVGASTRMRDGEVRSGNITLTGQAGEVLAESAKLAVSWTRAHAALLGLPIGEDCPAHSWDVHIHLPAGAQPKDGPSAGITLAVALVSLFTGRCVRSDTALTGELTLRGIVLPVGGIKEKLIAAAAAGMKRVILPAGNMQDAENDVPEEVKSTLELVGVERLDQALEAAFDPPISISRDHDGGLGYYPAARL